MTSSSRSASNTGPDTGAFVYVDDGAVVRRSADSLAVTNSVLVTSSPTGSGLLGRPLLVGLTGEVLAFDDAQFVPSGVAATVTLGANTQVTRLGERVLLLNSDGTFVLDGGAWSRLDTPTPSFVSGPFLMGAISATEAVAFNGSLLARFNGTSWTEAAHNGPSARQDAALATISTLGVSI